MPGKLYDGRDVTTAKNGVPQNSKAYCEGAAYRAGGTAAARPRADVTKYHPAGSEAAVAWEAGWDLAEANAGGQIPKSDEGPCGLGGVSVPGP